MPAFVIVCGPPASGKSRLATHLAERLHLPVISKDLVKERLMDHVGSAPEVGEAAFDVQFAVAHELLSAGTPFILEGAFFRNQQQLTELAARGQAVVVEVACDVETLERRYAEREQAGRRHPGHRGLEALPDLRRRVSAGDYGVPEMNRPVLRVDSTEGFQPAEDEVVEWVGARLGRGLIRTERPAGPLDLRTAWDAQAEAWTRWAREPNHDSYWRFGRDAFFALLPPPGRLTVDVGCGEGRVSRDLVAAGHRVVALDGSHAMARAAREASPELPLMVADGSRLPIADGACDLVIAYMTLQDFDDMPQALREAARVLADGGRLCLGTVHPINSAGQFASQEADAPFVIEGSYFEPHAYVDHIERDGLQMTFSSRHHSLEDYFAAIAAAGFVVEALREIPTDERSAARGEPHRRWRRLPLFLFLRAVRSR